MDEPPSSSHTRISTHTVPPQLINHAAQLLRTALAAHLPPPDIAQRVAQELAKFVTDRAAPDATAKAINGAPNPNLGFAARAARGGLSWCGTQATKSSLGDA
jgi:hypothetical protein